MSLGEKSILTISGYVYCQKPRPPNYLPSPTFVPLQSKILAKKVFAVTTHMASGTQLHIQKSTVHASSPLSRRDMYKVGLTDDVVILNTVASQASFPKTQA